MGRRPLAVDVGDRDAEDPRRRQPLDEPPADELRQTARGRRQQRRRRQAERRSDDHPLPADEISDASDDRRRDGDRQRRRRHRQAHREMRRVEHAHQQRQEWLRGVEIEEGAEAAEDDRERRGGRSVSMNWVIE